MTFEFEQSNPGGALSDFLDSDVRDYAIRNGIVAPDPRGQSFGSTTPIVTGLDPMQGREDTDDENQANSPSSWTVV